ncbi:MAG: cupredoxin domain-containing protein [Candidatus Bathyarchaeia archaeon]
MMKKITMAITIIMCLSIFCLNLPVFLKAANETKVIEIKAMNWAYDPPEIWVTEGDHVILNLTSLDTEHIFVIDEYNIHVTLTRGVWVTVEFIADKPGDFYYYCAVSAHRGYGEQGILHVLPAGKIHTTLTVSFSKVTANTGERVEVTGSIDPPVGGVVVRLIYTRPDGKTKVSEVITAEDGTFKDFLVPDIDGRWEVVANWLGDEEHFGSESKPAYLIVQAPFPILYVGAGIGALIAVGVIYYIIKQKRKPPSSS